MIYTPTKSAIDGLIRAIEERAVASPSGWKPKPKLLEIADGLPPEVEACKRQLMLGIGVHHASISKFQHWAIEEAASKGLLRYLVCTDTLLSGVDFPVRSIIVANSTRNMDFLPASVLNNLAGRAGRGGRFYSGEFVLMTPTCKRAKELFEFLASELPPTLSQFKAAVEVLLRVKDAVAITEGAAAVLRELDSFLLAAIAEAALEQGDIRLELEKALGRTLWWAGASPSLRDQVLTASVARAKKFQSSPDGWNQAVYRTGLDGVTCWRIKELLDDLDTKSLAAIARQEMSVRAGDESLASLALLVAEVNPTGRRWPQDLDEQDVREQVVRAWLSGSEAPADLNCQKVETAFEQLANQGPWIVGAALEVVRWKHGLTTSEMAHLAGDLALSRLRTGTPSEGAATLVEAGLPRTDAAALWHRYDRCTAPDFIQFAKRELPPKTVELMSWPCQDGLLSTVSQSGSSG